MGFFCNARYLTKKNTSLSFFYSIWVEATRPPSNKVSFIVHEFAKHITRDTLNSILGGLDFPKKNNYRSFNVRLQNRSNFPRISLTFAIQQAFLALADCYAMRGGGVFSRRKTNPAAMRSKSVSRLVNGCWGPCHKNIHRKFRCPIFGWTNSIQIDCIVTV